MDDAPVRRNGNVNELTSQGRDQISRVPFLDGLPRGCSTSNDEGGVAGDKPHELEGTWFLGEFFNDEAVEVVEGCKELLKSVVYLAHLDQNCLIPVTVNSFLALKKNLT